MARKTKNQQETSPEAEELLTTDPPVINPYEVLQVEKTATPDEIKKAYRKAALLHHPDKVQHEDKSSAHTKFQEIAFAYAILSDSLRRELYDRTGRTDETLEGDESFSWPQFYSKEYSEIVDEIEDFTKEYKGSEEEANAVLEAYEKYKGDMNKLYQVVMVSNVLSDDERFRKIIDDAIREGRTKAFKKYTQEGKKSKERRMKNAKREAKDAEKEKANMDAEHKGKGDDDGMDSLKALISGRQRQRQGMQNDFLANLEAKYAEPKKGKKRSGEPPESAFDANKKRAKKSKKVEEEEAADDIEE